MPLKFTKMHGLANDYVYVDVSHQRVEDPASLARAMSDRHRGIGSDGLILIGPPDVAGADARMCMFNADGSRGRMCGNGIRCVGKLVYESGLARVNPLRVQTDRGVLTLELVVDADETVTAARVDMGPPTLSPAQIPVLLDGDKVVGVPVTLGEKHLTMTCVSLGNPHAVFFERDLSVVPLAEWGPALEHHALFPECANIHFAEIVRPDFVKLITWERGSGITQACGTGASAVCVAGVLNGLTDRIITVEQPGGKLEVEWDESSDHVFMTGPAETVFTGEWPTSG